MVGGVGGGLGGISGLLDLIESHGEAITYDLLTVGVRLAWVGTEQFSWADFSAWVQMCPPTSRLWQEFHGPYYPLDWQLLGNIIEQLRGANWQRGGSRGGKPKPIRWPWTQRDEIQTFGSSAPLDDVRDFLVARNGRAPT